MGVLKRGKDGVYRHVRGEVPWADNALDRIAEEDRMSDMRRRAMAEAEAALPFPKWRPEREKAE